MHPFAINIPYTLAIMANVGRDPVFNTIKRQFVAEFDCELAVEYSDTDNWEIDHITFEQTRWNDEFTVSAKSDPDLWKLVQRGLDYDWKDLNDKVRERIIGAGEDIAAMREDAMHDQWQEYR